MAAVKSALARSRREWKFGRSTYNFSVCVAKPPIKIYSTTESTESICLIWWPCFFGLCNPQNQINWLGSMQLPSLNLTWWGVTYHKSSRTLSINSLKSSKFIRQTPRIIDKNNFKRSSDKIVFSLTWRQNSFWDSLTATATSISSPRLSIN